MSKYNKEHFHIAYTTGSDVWTHIPYAPTALSMIRAVPPDTLVLDVGSGRGLWAFRMVDRGLRVIGLEYIEPMVQKNNHEVKSRGIGDQIRFIHGDVLDIPFTDNGFGAVTDIGLLQHLPADDWPAYTNEIGRVISPGGYYLNVSLSRETKKFMDIEPMLLTDGAYTKFGLSYYFFTDDEIADIFSDHFDIVQQRHETYDSAQGMRETVTLVFTLMQKK